jgi:hypothetical protein
VKPQENRPKSLGSKDSHDSPFAPLVMWRETLDFFTQIKESTQTFTNKM